MLSRKLMSGSLGEPKWVIHQIHFLKFKIWPNLGNKRSLNSDIDATTTAQPIPSPLLQDK